MINGYQIWKGDRSWIFDNVAAYRIIYAYAQALHINAAPIRQTSLSRAPGAKLADIDLDWSKIRAAAASQSLDLDYRLNKEVVADPDAAFATLVRYHWKTRLFRNRINQGFGIVQSQNQSAIQSAEDWIKGVRDSALAVVCIAGGAVGGTVALTVGVGGALVNGAVKYYDTGDVAQAGWATFGGLCMVGWGAVVGGPVFQQGLDASGKAIIIGFGVVMDSFFEVGGGALEGKSGRELTVAGVTKIVSGAVGQTLNAKIDAAALKVGMDQDPKVVEAIRRIGEVCKANVAGGQKLAETFAPAGIDKLRRSAAPRVTQLPIAAKSAAMASGADAASIQFIKDRVLAPY